MADIVLTVPKKESKNAMAEIKDIIEKGYEAFWTLGRVPKIEQGERVYFARDGQIRESMRFLRMKMNSRSTCETTGREWSGRCQIFLDDFRPYNGPQVNGFRGFRYRWWEHLSSLPDHAYLEYKNEIVTKRYIEELIHKGEQLGDIYTVDKSFISNTLNQAYRDYVNGIDKEIYNALNKGKLVVIDV